MFTLPRFLRASNDTVNGTGVQSWNATEKEHIYALAVEPMTGISVKGHKTYQLNHVLSKTSVMYPDLWTVQTDVSSPNTITVPIYWVRMSWEPTDADAYLLRAMRTLISYMYTILVIISPSIGSTLAISCILLLLLGKDAVERKKGVAKRQENRGKALVFRSLTPRKIHVHASEFANDDLDRSVILRSVSEAVGVEDASDEEEFISSAHILP